MCNTVLCSLSFMDSQFKQHFCRASAIWCSNSELPFGSFWSIFREGASCRPYNWLFAGGGCTFPVLHSLCRSLRDAGVCKTPGGQSGPSWAPSNPRLATDIAYPPFWYRQHGHCEGPRREAFHSPGAANAKYCGSPCHMQGIAAAPSRIQRLMVTFGRVLVDDTLQCLRPCHLDHQEVNLSVLEFQSCHGSVSFRIVPVVWPPTNTAADTIAFPPLTEWFPIGPSAPWTVSAKCRSEMPQAVEKSRHLPDPAVPTFGSAVSGPAIASCIRHPRCPFPHRFGHWSFGPATRHEAIQHSDSPIGKAGHHPAGMNSSQFPDVPLLGLASQVVPPGWRCEIGKRCAAAFWKVEAEPCYLMKPPGRAVVLAENASVVEVLIPMLRNKSLHRRHPPPPLVLPIGAGRTSPFDQSASDRRLCRKAPLNLQRRGRVKHHRHHNEADIPVQQALNLWNYRSFQIHLIPFLWCTWTLKYLICFHEKVLILHTNQSWKIPEPRNLSWHWKKHIISIQWIKSCLRNESDALASATWEKLWHWLGTPFTLW